MKKQSGFTIVETLIYLGLFAIVMTGIIVAAYNMFELSGRTQTKAMLTAEGNFLLGKVNWVMSGVQTVSLPTSGNSGSTLSVTKWDTTFGNPIQQKISSGKMRIQKASGPISDLNN